MRDVDLETTFYLDFTTRTFSTGVPTTLLGTPTFSVLEENNGTPIMAGTAISVDRASVVGLNMCTIVATAANGFESGKGYSVYIAQGTVGGVDVTGEVIGSFTVGVEATRSTDNRDQILTGTMTEAYAADGANATLSEMLYMIHSSLSEFAISGTVLTCKKLDGSTTAMTFTLAPDGDNPTSRTRAT